MFGKTKEKSKPKKFFRGISIGIPQHQKDYLIYVLSTWKIVLHMTLYLKKHLPVR